MKREKMHRAKNESARSDTSSDSKGATFVILINHAKIMTLPLAGESSGGKMPDR